MTDKKQPASSSSAAPEANSSSSKDQQTSASVNKAKPVVKTSTGKAQNTARQNKSSNGVAWLAILLGLVAVGGSAGHYYWQQSQQQVQANQLAQQANTAISQQQAQNVAQFENLLKQQEQQLTDKFTEFASRQLGQQVLEQQGRIEQLETAMARLSQRQSSDWLVSEAEYLLRVASRSLLFKQDSQAAIALLNDADERLATLNQDQYFAVRAAIHQDIQTLQGLPAFDNETVLLKLLALQQQSLNLPIVIPDEIAPDPDLVLSENPDDWQRNLLVTVQKFIEGFVKVRRRADSEAVKPVLSAEQHRNLSQNLALKIQQVQQAVNHQQQALYLSSLQDIQFWLERYYDLDSAEVIAFLDSVKALQGQTISFQSPPLLLSVAAMQQAKKPVLNELPLKSDGTGDDADTNQNESDQSQVNDQPTINKQGEQGVLL